METVDIGKRIKLSGKTRYAWFLTHKGNKRSPWQQTPVNWNPFRKSAAKFA
jgi:hypothetical protein